MGKTNALGVFALLLYVWGRVEGIFNTDVRDPVLRLSPALLSNDHPDKEDLFGFAIALHPFVELDDDDGVQERAGKLR